MTEEAEHGDPDPTQFLSGGGERGDLMRRRDWSTTPFGSPVNWPQSLRSAVSIMLNSRYPIALYWGPELALLYNDAWSPIPGGKHPWALGRPGREVWPEIWDTIGPLFDKTGSGMDEATLARAVEPFFSTKGVGKGTGLGLSMVHGLASQLGGALAIQSRRGVGTHVELWLPINPEPVTNDAAQHQSATPSGSGTALLVDDEDLVRASTADMLTDLGYAVVEAPSAEEALRLIRNGVRPDLLVTDHLMPGMNGTDLARIARSERPGLQVLLVSGYAEAEGIAPDLPRLTKPFRSDELANRLAGIRKSNDLAHRGP